MTNPFPPFPDNFPFPATKFTVRGVKRCQVLFNYPCGLNQYGFYFGLHQENPVLPAVPPTGDKVFDPLPAGEFMPTEVWLRPKADVDAGTVGTPPADGGAFELNLISLRDLGVVAVRLFLMCNALNWGTNDSAGKITPPPYLHPRFITHFQEVLRLCKKHNMLLIPSLLDFGICEPRIGPKRRTQIVTDFDTQQAFYDQVLEPLLDESTKQAVAGVVFAWEIMNEPTWLSATFFPWSVAVIQAINLTRPQINTDPVSPTIVDAFLQEGITRIRKHSGNLQSTVGHRFFRELAKRPTGTLPQCHYYPNFLKGVLDFGEGSPLPAPVDPLGNPKRRANGRRLTPPFLGELGSAADQGDPWNELKGADGPGARERVRERLFAAERSRYTLAGVWPDRNIAAPTPSNPDPLKLSPEGQQGILDFVLGTKPTP